MKKKLLKFKEKRTALLKRQKAIFDLIKSEKRDLTEEEQSQIDALATKVDDLDTRISNLETAEEVERKLRETKVRTIQKKETEEKKVQKRFSLLRAISLKVQGKALDGVELEMHQEAQKEAKEIGMGLRGIGIPTVISTPQTRELTAGSAVSAGNTIATDLAEFQDSLVPKTCLEELGAKMITGLVGNLDIPIGDALATANWEGEGDSDAESTPTTKKESLTPHRLAATSIISKQWLNQTSVSVERLVFEALRTAEKIALEQAGFNGAGGAADDPLGILNHADVNVVAMGANGLAPTHTKLVELQTVIETANADDGNLAYVLTPEIIGYLKTTKIDAGSGLFIMDSKMPNELLGYMLKKSNLLPKTLTKGTSVGVCHAGIFGDFSKLWIGNWGVRDLLVNPYSSARAGKIEITLDSYWDLAPIHGQAFGVIKDLLTA